jgi:iron complex outermembrane receptor protein
MKKYSIFFMILFLCQLTFGQNEIGGIITDGSNNKPLAGATVFVIEQNKGTVTDNNGNFRITGLPNGKFKIQASYLGYNNLIETVFLNNKPLKLDFVLKQTPIETQEIVVSGGYNSTQHDNAVKIDVLNLTTSKNYGSPNFAEILTTVPGVDMISKGSGVSKPVIRGLSMNDILVLNNGVRFENYQYSDHHPMGIDEFGIEKVEIIKGPASLLYGSDAIGGVIDFVKEKPAPVGQVTGDYNLQLFSNSMGITNNLGVKGASKKVFGGIRFGMKSHEDYLQGEGDFVPNSRFNESSFKANAGFTSKTGTFKLFYDFNDQKLGLTEPEAVEQVTERGRKNEIWYQQFENHMISSQNKLFLGNYKLEFNAAFQNTGLIHFGTVDEIELEMSLRTLTYETKLYLPSTKNSEYIIGFQGLSQDNVNLNNRETMLLPDANTVNYSVFGLLQQTFYHKLRLQSGLRYDYKIISTETTGVPTDYSWRPGIEKNYGSFSGSIGGTYNYTEELLFRVNFAAAYRTPNLAELTSNGKHETRYELGNSGLIPQNAYESDFSIHYHSEHVTFDIAGFYNLIDNYIFITPSNDSTPDGDEIYKYQQTNATLFGGEAGFHIHPKPMDWLHIQATFSNVTGKQKSGDYLPFIPANKLHFEVWIEKEKVAFLRDAFIKLNTQTAFNQHNPAPDEEKTDGYSLVDFGVGAKLKAANQMISIGITMTNIFDKKYIDHLSTLKEVSFFNPGRNLVLTEKIPFGIR